MRWAPSRNRSRRSLATLLERRDVNRGTCRLVCDGVSGSGEMVLESGWVVHAAYGGLEGLEAARALLDEQCVCFRAIHHRPVRNRSMHLSSTELLRQGDPSRVPMDPVAGRVTRRLRRGIASWLPL